MLLRFMTNVSFAFSSASAYACNERSCRLKVKFTGTDNGAILRKETYPHQKIHCVQKSAFRMRCSCLNGVPSCKAKSARRPPLRQWRHRLYRLVGVINFPFINAVFVTFVASSVGGLLLGPVKRFSRIPLAF